MSRKFPQALIAFAFVAFATVNLSATTYYIAANGSDSNNGTSKTGAWLHAPGMNGCSSVCASTTPQSGDQIIFRGGDNWGASNFNTWVWHWSGSSGNPIYIGVDETYYSGGSWARPVMDGGGSPNGVYKFLELASGVAYVTVDNLEWTGMYSNLSSPASGQVDYVDISRNINSHIHIENNYFHGGNVAHDGAHSAHFLIASMGSGDSSNEVDHNVFDNSDVCRASNPPVLGGPTCTIDAVEGTIWSFHDNYVGYFSCGYVTDWATLIYENTMEVIVLSPDNGVDHENGTENNGGTGVIMFNNVIRHFVNGGIVDFQLAPVSSSSYAFNNVLPDMDGGNMEQCYEGSPANNHCVWFNNTAEAGPDSGNPSGSCGRNTGSNTTSAVTNQHCITSAGGTSWWQGTASFTTNLAQSKTTANSQGYSNSTTYAFSPTEASGSTVGAGTNMSNTCATISSLNATAGSACMHDTTYGVAYNTSNHAITGPGRPSTNQRPSGAAWDIGAYQFSSSSAQLNPPTGLAAVVQ
jgi:hypothetical protein